MIKKIDPVHHVRQNMNMYLGREEVVQDELATFIVDDALVLGAQRTIIVRSEGWWVIGADIDWLLTGHQKEIEDVFCGILPLLGGGQNASRREILLTAFTDNIVTMKNNDLIQTVIKGEGAPEIVLSLFQEYPTKFERLIAFQLKSQ